MWMKRQELLTMLTQSWSAHNLPPQVYLPVTLSSSAKLHLGWRVTVLTQWMKYY